MREVPNQTGLCMCGCGQTTNTAPQTMRALGYRKGEHYRYIASHVHAKTTPSNPKKYVTRYVPLHPHASASGCVYEHVLVAERALGRFLPDGAFVHHVDGNRQNNTPKNLVICQDAAYHSLLHVRQRVLDAGGDPNVHRVCSKCRGVLPLDAFANRSSSLASGKQAACIGCMNEYRRQRKARLRNVGVSA